LRALGRKIAAFEAKLGIVHPVTIKWNPAATIDVIPQMRTAAGVSALVTAIILNPVAVLIHTDAGVAVNNDIVIPAVARRAAGQSCQSSSHRCRQGKLLFHRSRHHAGGLEDAHTNADPTHELPRGRAIFGDLV
jgi:hypothetical protein